MCVHSHWHSHALAGLQKGGVVVDGAKCNGGVVGYRRGLGEDQMLTHKQTGREEFFRALRFGNGGA